MKLHALKLAIGFQQHLTIDKDILHRIVDTIPKITFDARVGGMCPKGMPPRARALGMPPGPEFGSFSSLSG